MGTLTNGHHRWPPGLVTLRGYQRPWLRGDLIAGLTVAAYLVPQVMAYAGVAGLPPVTGLWAALAPLACYAVLGSSRLVSLGPESTTALMTAVAIGPLAAGDPSRYAALAAMLALLVGLLAVVAWLVRLGFVADLLSRPVLVGYLAGVALIMMAGQLGRLTGVRVSGESFTGQVASFTGQLAHVNPADVVIAAAVLVLLFTAQSRWPRLPGPLAAVLLSTALCAIFSLGQHGVALVGHIPAGLPTPGLPKVDLNEVRELMLPALGVLLVAFSDDVLTGRAFERGSESIDANTELLALGVSNAGAGLLRGFPISSSGSRTAIGLTAGAHTQAYSLTALASILGVLLFARPVLASFPEAALGESAVRIPAEPGLRGSPAIPGRLAGAQPGAQQGEPQLFGGHQPGHPPVFDNHGEQLATQRQAAQQRASRGTRISEVGRRHRRGDLPEPCRGAVRVRDARQVPGKDHPGKVATQAQDGKHALPRGQDDLAGELGHIAPGGPDVRVGEHDVAHEQPGERFPGRIRPVGFQNCVTAPDLRSSMR